MKGVRIRRAPPETVVSVVDAVVGVASPMARCFSCVKKNDTDFSRREKMPQCFYPIHTLYTIGQINTKSCKHRHECHPVC